MNGHEEWDKALFQALTSHHISRNRYFATFAQEMFRAVHRRFRTVDSLRREADRLVAVPGSTCWVREEDGSLHFHLRSPRLGYRREFALRRYEWDWLLEQEGIRALLGLKALEG